MDTIKSIKIENLNGGTEAEVTRINALPVFTNWAELNTEANRIMEGNLIFDITILITFEDKTTKRMNVDYMTYTKFQVNNLRMVNDTFQERLETYGLTGEFVEGKETNRLGLTQEQRDLLETIGNDKVTASTKASEYPKLMHLVELGILMAKEVSKKSALTNHVVFNKVKVSNKIAKAMYDGDALVSVDGSAKFLGECDNEMRVSCVGLRSEKGFKIEAWLENDSVRQEDVIAHSLEELQFIMKSFQADMRKWSKS